jgi:hypothetical protein
MIERGFQSIFSPQEEISNPNIIKEINDVMFGFRLGYRKLLDISLGYNFTWVY